MRYLRLLPRLLLVTLALGAFPFLALANLATRDEVARARARYEVAAKDVRRANKELEETEERLRRLTSSVHAVEIEARRQLRLAKSNEKFILIQYQSAE